MRALKICLISVSIGFLSAVLSLSETGLHLEEEWGLAWLFSLRGPVEAPRQVTIVSIDKISADILRLPEDPEKWPRTYHAELINKINQQKPALIAFNLYFGETRHPDQDENLANAMKDEGNVILSNYLKQVVPPYGTFLNHLRYEFLVDPIPLFASEALAVAPFPLPKTASTVKQFWTFRRNSGDIPTFPAAIFLSYLLNQTYRELLDVVAQIDPGFAANLPDQYRRHAKEIKVLDFFQHVHSQLRQTPQTLAEAERVLASLPASREKKRLLKSWLSMVKGNDNQFINYYGKAGAITTIPFYQALVSDILNPAMFHNKIVLIGYSEDIQPEKSRGFYSVFSETNGETVSPIEIAATAVANLIEKSWLQPLPLWHQFLLILGWSVVLSVMCRFLPYKFAVASVVMVSLIYVVIAYYLFIEVFLWIPILFPIFVLTPVFLILATTTHYIKRKKEHHRIYKTFSLYLPDEVVNSLVQLADHEEMGEYGRTVDGVCMATDAGQYTSLSETMDPGALKDLMNRYYGTIFPQVKNSSGFISDVIGDAMLALWIEESCEINARLNACQAALDIEETINRFNRSQPYQLPTRIGLHFGRLHLGNVGAVDHYEYRAVGDIVNTATRIEGLNKLLGTHILVSDNVIEHLSGFFTREVGLFILKGKTLPIRIHELIARNDRVDARCVALTSAFSDSLRLFQQYQWDQALESFLAIAEEFHDDGATFFFINYLRDQMTMAGEHKSDGVAVIEIGNITTPLH